MWKIMASLVSKCCTPKFVQMQMINDHAIAKDDPCNQNKIDMDSLYILLLVPLMNAHRSQTKLDNMPTLKKWYLHNTWLISFALLILATQLVAAMQY